MRTLMIAGLAMVTAIGATQAGAQRVLSNGQVWMNGHAMPAQSAPMPVRQAPQMPPPQQQIQRQHHWGGSIGGHWQGGSNAPGGWNAYRRPSRGWVLPRYWIAPSFYINDYGTYGLSAPPRGYTWSRYYDDAVLMDQRGRVLDSVNGIDWDSYDDGYGYGGGYADAGYGAAAAAGGGYGASYAPPVQYQQGPAYPLPPPPPVQNGYVTTWSNGAAYAGSGGYVSGGYWYPPVTTTTVTIQSAPVVTTTTTEYIETTRYVPARRVYRAKHVVRRHSCNCGCCR